MVEEEHTIQTDLFFYTRFYYTVEEEHTIQTDLFFTPNSITRWRKSMQYRQICFLHYILLHGGGRAHNTDRFVFYTRFYYMVEEEHTIQTDLFFTLDSTTRWRKSMQFRWICLFTLDSTTQWRKSMQFRWICLFTLDSTTRWRKSTQYRQICLFTLDSTTQ